MDISFRSNWASHPISLIALEVLTTAYVLGFTSPSSTVRLGALPLVVTACWFTISTCNNHMPRFWTMVIAGNAPTYLIRYIELALLGKWSFAAGGPTSSTISVKAKYQQVTKGSGTRTDNKDVARRGTAWTRLLWGLGTTVFPRHIGTSMEVKNVPRFSGGRVPSRAWFLWRTAMVIFISYLIVDCSSLAEPPEAGLLSP